MKSHLTICRDYIRRRLQQWLLTDRLDRTTVQSIWAGAAIAAILIWIVGVITLDNIWERLPATSATFMQETLRNFAVGLQTNLSDMSGMADLIAWLPAFEQPLDAQRDDYRLTAKTPYSAHRLGDVRTSNDAALLAYKGF